MASALPEYYSTLASFGEAFRRGRPILTYHCVGPRPWGARLKGLYLPTRWFQRQLSELRAAGFVTAGLAEVSRPASEPPAVVITFDDGCRNVRVHALPVLEETGFRAVVFLVADLLGRTTEWQARAGGVAEPLMDEAEIRDWLAAGHAIGSHTCTHPWLTRLSPSAAREEITASRRKLEDRFGVPVRDFCYPYGDFDARVRDLVAEAGYRTAVTTRPGLNGPETPRLELRRWTARYPSRRLRHLWQRWRAAWKF